MRRRSAFIWATVPHRPAEKFWLIVLCLLFVGGSWLLYSTWDSSQALQAQAHSLKKTIAKVQDTNSRLSAHARATTVDFVVETNARRMLGKTRSGERVVVVNPQPFLTQEATSKSSGPRAWWAWVFPITIQTTMTAQTSF